MSSEGNVNEAKDAGVAEQRIGSGSPSGSLACSGPLVEFVGDVTGGPAAVRPEHINSMSRFKGGGLTKISTELGFFLAREPDYCSLVTHWRELLNGNCSFTGKEVIREL